MYANVLYMNASASGEGGGVKMFGLILKDAKRFGPLLNEVQICSCVSLIYLPLHPIINERSLFRPHI